MSTSACRPVFALVLAPFVASGVPAQDNAAERHYTKAEHSSRRLQFHQDAFLADYRSRCTEESPPSAAVEDLLRFYVERFRSDFLSNQDDRQVILQRARSVLHSGDEDPLVLLAAGDALFMSSRFSEALSLLQTAASGLESGSSSAFVQWFAAQRLDTCFYYSPGVEPGEAAAAARLEDLLVEAIADPVFADGNQRFYLELVMAHLDSDISAEDRDFVERLKQVEGAHRYPLLFLDGKCHTAEAWVARGSGYANTVTEEGWSSFYDHLEKAADGFATAHALEPDFPEAPAAMLTVAGGAGAPGGDLREWFDATIQAQFDFGPAYESVLNFSLPRWGGSHRQMMELGLEWAATGRYDTSVPDMFRVALAVMLLDLEATELFSSGIVQKTLDTVHEGYMREFRDRASRLSEVSQHVVVMALGGRVEEAAATYQSMDGEFEEWALQRYRVDRPWLMSQIEPHLRPHVPEHVADFDVYEGFAGSRYDGTYDPQPIPAGPDAPTSARALAAQAAWTDTVCLDAYREHGERDAKWDEGAEELVGGYGGFVFAEQDSAALAAHLETATAVLEAGCDDPLVYYIAARSYERAGDADRTLELLQQAVEGFRTAEYPAMCAFWAARRLEALLRERSRVVEADALLPVIEERAVAMASDPLYQGDAARYYVATVFQTLDLGWITGPLTEGSVRRIAEDEAVDPWIRQVVPGLFHAAKATSESTLLLPLAGRETYFEHVAAAVEHLTSAHALRPDFPEAATVMIVLASMETGELTSRAWFDRAVSVEMDFEPAYGNFLWFLRPASGGSVKAMYRFGVECLETGRFDTVVPAYYLRAVEFAAPLLQDWRWAWSSPDFARRYEALAAGAIDARGDTWGPFFDAGRYMTAWAGGRYEDAASLWDAAGRTLHPEWLDKFGVEQETVNADLRWALEAKNR